MGYRSIENKGLYDSRFEHDSCGVGFVCNIKRGAEHEIVDKGIEVLERLSHRGATGADPKTGDGAGILIQIPHEFFDIELPSRGDYAVGMIFLPTEKKQRLLVEKKFEDIIVDEGQVFIGWRDVPVDNSDIGPEAKKTEPIIRQIFIGKGSSLSAERVFERKLYIIRRRIENEVINSSISQKDFFCVASLSSRTIAYKGLLMPSQVKKFFPDLSDPRLKSALALVHSRYSTNTFPTWDLAQPFRYLAHNGEINTLRGNLNWMKARERLLSSELFGKDISKALPLILEGGSDSAALDNALELLLLSGRSLPHAVMMLVPIAWQGNKFIKKEQRDFYEYHSAILEPWDGPAALAFTDGRYIGGSLDRNGLRPARYVITKDGMVCLASESGVLDIEPENVVKKGRLLPGKIFLIDTKEGRIIDDEQIKDDMAARQPYGKWLKKNVVRLDDLPLANFKEIEIKDLASVQKSVGYTKEDLKLILSPMAEKGEEPIGSMGNDSPLAMFSNKPHLLYNYFKQLFAQVTNPPIDPIREKLVMSLGSYIGPGKNLLAETPDHCNRLRVEHPILTNEELEKIRNIDASGFSSKTVSLLFDPFVKGALKAALDKLNKATEKAIDEGHSFVILSDRGIDKKHVAIPALLAVSSVHHNLVKKKKRTQAGLILESAEPREVMHFALLFGYGIGAVNPYLSYASIADLAKEKEIITDPAESIKNYIKAVEKGLLKILSKMGISTLQSYRGAQIFEVLGIGPDVIEKYFPGTVSRIGGIDLSVIEKETISRHINGFNEKSLQATHENGGVYQWRRDGEFHLWNPESIPALQLASRDNDKQKYQEFSRLINDQDKNLTTIRGSLKFKGRKSISIDEVEPASEIVKRFVTGAMSFGSISKETHETIAIAMNRLGGKSNSGEGGEEVDRFYKMASGDSKRSAIKQVASGRFGVTSNYLANADELQIKISQGAKPGEGGQLPGHKVNDVIAKVRFSTPGVTLISPPPHHDIYSIEDLAQLIFDLKNANPQARISVKLVSEIGVGTVAAGVAKAHADMILIAGGDGGTGASPLSSIKHAGVPWELGLAETHQTLVMNDLRSRVRLQADGQMRTGRDVVIASMLGAEEFGFATAILITLGCVMLRHCHINNCSLGVATQDEECRKRFNGKPENIQHYLTFVAEEAREIMASLGISKLDDLVGRVDLLEQNKELLNWKTKGLDVSKILYKPEVKSGVGIKCSLKQDHGIEKVMDRELIKMSQKSIQSKEPVKFDMAINNVDRAVGTMLSGVVSSKWGEEALPENTIHVKFKGTAGQSFGAFLAKGITFELEGEANDYVGKGLSGGKIIIYPDKRSEFNSEENIIVGNTSFYGATSGEAYIRGIAGERFCIRNSGLYTVVEGVGDHGCEYMTGGRVLILGPTGRNFAAGMSGGIAYVYDPDKILKTYCNPDMVELEQPSLRDESRMKYLMENHLKYTGSPVAKKILDDFDNEIKNFFRVIPTEYKKILMEKNKKQVIVDEYIEG